MAHSTDILMTSQRPMYDTVSSVMLLNQYKGALMKNASPNKRVHNSMEAINWACLLHNVIEQLLRQVEK